MMVFVVNKLKDYIEASNLNDIEHKSAVGCYEASTFAKNLKNLQIDNLLIDITAIKDANNKEAWDAFKELVPSENIFVLQESSSSNYELFAVLVNNGIYNFGKSTNEIIYCMERPNTFADVKKYVSRSAPITKSSLKAGKELAGYSEKNQKQQDAMKDYLQKYNDGDFDVPKSKNVLGIQLLTGLVQLPLLTLLSTGVFYLLSRILYSRISYDTFLGKAVFDGRINTNFNLVVLIGLFISLLIFLFYFSILDAKIKKNQYTRGKFMILPMGLYSLIFFGDYYLFGILEKVFGSIPNITSADYLFEEYVLFNYLVVIMVIVAYYFKVAISKSKVLVFEKDLSQKFNIVEKCYVIILGISIAIPILYYLINAVSPNASICEFVSELYIDGIFMLIITVIGIVATIFILVNRILFPVQKLEYEEMNI